MAFTDLATVLAVAAASSAVFYFADSFPFRIYMQHAKERYQTLEYLQHEQWYHDVLQVSLHASPLEIEGNVCELASTTSRDLHQESRCLLNMDARRDYLKTLLVSDRGKDHVSQMVVNTKCVLARYQRDASIYSRDEAGNGVEEFVEIGFLRKSCMSLTTTMCGHNCIPLKFLDTGLFTTST